MKNQYMTVIAVLVACPLFAFATPATDRKIETAATSSYNYRALLENRVKVSAYNGAVTLTGTVESQYDRELAGDTAGNLPGVTNVDNQLRVDPTYPEKSDAWMAFKIRSALLVKSKVSATSTKVEVKDGHATLHGTADSAVQKELTGIYAKEIEGIKSVKNELVVTDKPTLSEQIDDASITSQVKFALLANKSTSSVKTKVLTSGGVVLVTGEAGSEAEKSLVTQLAQDVRGVGSVSNNMTVKS